MKGWFLGLTICVTATAEVGIRNDKMYERWNKEDKKNDRK